MPKKLLLLEFNELCPSLLHRWMAIGKLPNFKRFYEGSQAYLTLADAEPPALEPWIQWYSIHTGLSFDQHRVFRLTEGLRADHPDIWTVLQKAGLKTANCASMNARESAAQGCFFLPDPWATSVRPFPTELDHFHRFVSSQVREHTYPGHRLRPRDAVAFLGFLVGHGLRLKTIAAILSQLCHEAFSASDVRWKRVAILDLLQFDIFFHYLRRLSPDFCTFFSNSTAHLQHAYWKHMQPADFDVPPAENEMKNYSNAILYGYQSMDNLLAKFFDLEKEGMTLALASGLSQKPFLKYEDVGGQRFYRPRDIGQLLGFLGVCPQSIEPVMAHEYVLRFATVEDCANAVEALLGISCEGEGVFDVHMDGDIQLYLGSRLQIVVPADADLKFKGSGDNTIPFYDVFYLIDERKSGCHDPEGIFWFKAGRPMVHSERISILDIFPTVIEFMGIGYRPSESHPYKGRSRVDSWSGA